MTWDITNARDTYLFRTVSVAPTSATSEALIQPGIATPGAANVSNANVRVATGGTLRQNATTAPSIVLTIADRGLRPLAAWPIADIIALVRSGSDDIKYTDIKRLATNPNRPYIVGGSVPRLGIQRYNYDRIMGGDDAGTLGVTDVFAEWDTITDITPPLMSGTWTVAGEPWIVEGFDGELLLIYACQKDGVSYDGDIVIYRWDPSTETTWSVYTHVADASLSTLCYNEPNVFAPYELAVWRDDAVGNIWLGVLGENADGPRAAILRLEVDTLRLYTTSLPTFDLTAIETRLGACQLPGGALLALPDATAGMKLAYSADLQTWDETTGLAAFPSFADYDVVYPATRGTRRSSKRANTSRISPSAYDLEVVYAATTAGEVLESTDVGQTWTVLDTPTRASRTNTRAPIALYDVANFGNIVVAVGEMGTILKLDNSVDTPAWKVIRFGATATEYFNANDIALTWTPGADTTLPALAFSRIRMLSETTWFLCGAGGMLYRTTTGGSAFTVLLPPFMRPSRAYRDFITDGTRMFLVGDAGIHERSGTSLASLIDPRVGITADDLWSRGVFLTGVDSVGSLPTVVSYHLHTELTDSSDIVGCDAGGSEALTSASSYVYSVSSNGTVFRQKGNGSDDLTDPTTIATLPTPTRAMGIAVGEAYADKVWICVDAGRTAYIYTSINGTGTTPTFVPQMIPGRGYGPWAIAAMKTSTTPVIIVGGEQQIWRGLTESNVRVYGDVCHIDATGDVFLVASNLTTGRVEIWRAPASAPGEMPSFALVDAALQFPEVAVPSGGPNDDTLRATLALSDDGTLVVTAGTVARLGLNYGREWVPATDTRAALPVGTFALDVPDGFIASADSINGKRRSLVFTGRLWSVAPNDTGTAIRTYVTWEWDLTGTHFRPIIENTRIYVGVDGLYVSFSGTPAIGDTWTVAPRYGYRKEHVVEPTQSMIWRSTAVTEQTIVWDRQDTAVEAVLGEGDVWDANSLALFNTNFALCYVGFSQQPSDATFAETAIEPRTILTAEAYLPTGRNPSSVIQLPLDVDLIPDQYAPGTVQWYAHVTGPISGDAVCGRILGNGVRHLVLDTLITKINIGDLTVSVFPNAMIYADTTEYPTLARYVRIRIPVQTTVADSYFQIGTAIPGKCPNSALFQPFADGAIWQPIVNTTQDLSPSGPAWITHYGRTGQYWTLTFPPMTTAERARIINPLLSQLRQPFAIQWGGTSVPVLVRLVDAQTVRHVIRDLAVAEYLLQEVV